MTHILCLETATEICSAALSADGECIACHEEAEGNSHAEKIMELTDRCLKDAGLAPENLDAVCISGGPGSYTGLRIGTSTAKGICYARAIPLIAVPSLEGIARGAITAMPDVDICCPMIDARRMEVYCALYDPHGNPLTEAESKIIDSKKVFRLIHIDTAKRTWPTYPSRMNKAINFATFYSAFNHSCYFRRHGNITTYSLFHLKGIEHLFVSPNGNNSRADGNFLAL